MERKDFLKTCGMACIGGALLAAFLEGCSPGKEVNGTIDRSDMVIPVSSFQSGKKYVVVSHERLKYPICVYRFSDTQYVALLMRCTHQGAELQVFGDRLQCPAHGSEFNNKGVVQNGPADTNLRTFPVRLQQNQLHISLQ
jgi:nitrite reductase/ring-hydroxylating ferredoxin subunit